MNLAHAECAKYEQYVARGYQAIDYIALSQFQRWRGLRKEWAAENGGVRRWPQFVWVWQITDEGYRVYTVLGSLKHMRWGFMSAQMWNELGLGPLILVWWMR